MKIVCLTSDVGNPLIPGFLHQWKKYASGLPVTVAGFTHPGVDCDFIGLGDFKDYPVNRWSNGLRKLLQMIEDDLVLLLLEDYWLIRHVNKPAIMACEAFMQNNPDFARCDVSCDRMEDCYPERNICSIGCTDFTESINKPYDFSYQASIWNRQKLLDLVVDWETPWESEINGNKRIHEKGYRVVGTRQFPMNYTIVMNKGKIDKTGGWMYPPRTLYPDDWKELETIYGY